jgi:hypothetical protein
MLDEPTNILYCVEEHGNIGTVLLLQAKETPSLSDALPLSKETTSYAVNVAYSL